MNELGRAWTLDLVGWVVHPTVMVTLGKLSTVKPPPLYRGGHETVPLVRKILYSIEGWGRAPPGSDNPVSAPGIARGFSIKRAAGAGGYGLEVWMVNHTTDVLMPNAIN
jgi:hypothetical protein